MINSHSLVQCGIMVSFRSLCNKSKSALNSWHSITFKDLKQVINISITKLKTNDRYLIVRDNKTEELSMKGALIK